MKSDAEVLRDAIELIRDEKSWIQGDWCETTPENVDQFCAEGAVLAANGYYTKQYDREEMSWYWEAKSVMESTSEETMSQGRRIFAAMVAKGREMFPDYHRDPKYFDQNNLWPDSVNEYNDSYMKHEEVISLMEKTAASLEEASS